MAAHARDVRGRAERKALVVDGDIASRARIAAELRELGFSATRAPTGDLGLAILRANADIALVVCSTSIDDMTVQQVLDSVRRDSHMQTAVIVVGRDVSPAAARAFLAAGNCRVISAPIRSEQLREHVTALTSATSVSGLRRR
jgi:CheY-like chemotaxis protein